MKEIKIKINDKSYKVKLAETAEQQDTGLKYIKTLPDNEGMLFMLEEPEEIEFWMKDTYIPLDIICIDEDLIVTDIFKGEPLSEDKIKVFANYILELNVNSGVKVGDEIEFELNKKPEPEPKLESKPEPEINTNTNMLVLNEGGEIQGELVGGERIFSRANTKILIKFAKKATITNNDNDYKALGKRVFKFLDIQSKNTPEYVKGKDSN